MANPQEQPYTEMVKQAQVALLAMLDTWNRSFQQAFGATPVNSELDRPDVRLRRQAGECSAECSAAVRQAGGGERHYGRQNRRAGTAGDRSPLGRFSSLKPRPRDYCAYCNRRCPGDLMAAPAPPAAATHPDASNFLPAVARSSPPATNGASTGDGPPPQRNPPALLLDRRSGVHVANPAGCRWLRRGADLGGLLGPQVHHLRHVPGRPVRDRGRTRTATTSSKARKVSTPLRNISALMRLRVRRMSLMSSNIDSSRSAESPAWRRRRLRMIFIVGRAISDWLERMDGLACGSCGSPPDSRLLHGADGHPTATDSNSINQRQGAATGDSA